MKTGDERRPTSTVCMTMVQSSGTWLNGAMVPQMHYVSLEVKDNENRLVARVGLTFEQVTRMLMYNGEVPCTLERYRGLDGKPTEEKVERPKTVHARMKERLGQSREELKDRIKDLERALYDAMNNKTAGKGKLQEMHSMAHTILQHFGGNDDFVVQQAEEELGTMQMQAACQLGVFLQTQHNLQLDGETLAKLLPVGEGNLLIDKSAKPVVNGYKAKERPVKDPSEMCARELADEILIYLKEFEATKENQSKDESALVFMPTTGEHANNIFIRYVSFHSTYTVDIDLARNYLIFLRNAKPAMFMRHFDFK